VLFLLYIKAELENVDSISLRKDNVNLCLTVRNPLSDYEIREKVVMNTTHFVEQDEGAREPPHHLRLKWEGSKKASTITVLEDSAVKTALKKKKGAQVPRDYTADDSGNWGPVLAIECRGLEPTAFFPMGDEFVITSKGGKQFTTDVDLSDGDWGEYDDENDGKSHMLDSLFLQCRPLICAPFHSFVCRARFIVGY
jgi:Eukaryotic protein of unknown function (DUF866)